jgi:coenzyme F420-dependent glucose-6-phosphate dehydrogenase
MRIHPALIAVAPKDDTVRTFEAAGGGGKLKYAEVTVCWAASEDEAKKTAMEWWPNVALPGELGQVLATPAHFEQACELVTEDRLAESIPCGPDPERHLESIRRYGDAGFDALFIHQIGPHQIGFLDFFKREVMPKIG